MWSIGLHHVKVGCAVVVAKLVNEELLNDRRGFATRTALVNALEMIGFGDFIRTPIAYKP